MVAKALCILAEGSEEMETVIIVDVLRRGGVEVNQEELSPPLPPVLKNINLTS